MTAPASSPEPGRAQLRTLLMIGATEPATAKPADHAAIRWFDQAPLVPPHLAMLERQGMVRTRPGARGPVWWLTPAGERVALKLVGYRVQPAARVGWTVLTPTDEILTVGLEAEAWTRAADHHARWRADNGARATLLRCLQTGGLQLCL